ncbi:MAG: amino acid adenylation domain-containing protein [Verrucomicrobiota bacterium]
MVHPREIPSAGGIEAYPLSAMQEGMLYHALQGGTGVGGKDVDVQQVICELPEAIDPARFEQAWRELVEKHAVLRTGFEWEGRTEPRQIVWSMAQVRLDFHCVEFGSETEAEVKQGIEDYLVADRERGFKSLAVPALLRVALFRSGAERSWFVTTYHHILIDARSMALMFREALERYEALVEGREIAATPERPYRRYIDWLKAIDWSASEGFWREHLKGFAAPAALPVARASAQVAQVETKGSAGSAVSAVACGERMLRLPATASEGLRRTAKQHGVTVNTLVQAAWALVLSRNSGEDDVVFGALRAGRHVPVEGAAETLGLFINTVPVRSRVTETTTVSAWLKALREQWVAIRAYEHTPLTKVQQWSEVAGGRPLFETLLNYQEPSWDASLNALGGKWAQRRFDIRSRPGYPLAIDIYGGETLTVKAFYERARLDDATVVRMLGHFGTILQALATDACVTVGELPMLTCNEREEIVVVWNRTQADYPRETGAHLEFQRHAEIAPERVAVTDANTTLTYGELNLRANRLAQRLRTLGVGTESLVAVCMERSAEMLVAWLGTLKAGGAFVPLDPGYPKDRLAFQLKDCGASVLLTQSRLRPLLSMLPTGVTLIDVPADGSGFEAESDRAPEVAFDSRTLAYVIYTSGSTGQPKGVQIEHRGLMNLVTWHQRLYAVTPADRATHLASPAFDASVWEIWPYLAAGASIHIPDDETRLSPGGLWRWMAEKKITLSFMPTPLAEAAMNEAWPAEMTLRALLTGGDKLKRRTPENFPCTLINHYGPTESTVVATCAVVDPRGAENIAPTIGRPIANTTAYVLDRALRPVPVGVAGELFIGGESLARGYLNRPELTAEKFVTVSVDGAAPVRLYRTGDLVRWTEEGQLEFVGRIDGQVKIRGCRIELGEIEATLQGAPGVRESLVITRTTERGQAELVAYVLAQPGTEILSEAELIGYLRAKLPGYMIPAAIVMLETWPLTPNGKIDRKALPAPAARTAAVDTPLVAPQTATEITVAQVWSDVLGCAKVGREDNFFDLGGHSLLAAQVISRLSAALGAPVSVRVLFDQPTLGAFAQELDRRAENHPAARTPVQRMKRRAARTELELVQPN